LFLVLWRWLLRKEEKSIALPGKRRKRRKNPIEGKREKTLSKTKDEKKIFYYKNRGDAIPVGLIDILTAAIRPAINNSFEIITPARIYLFYCSNEIEKQEWIEQLKEVILLYENM